MPSRLEWKGDELRRRTAAAAAAAIEDVTKDAAGLARAHHGWQSRTGKTEASIEPESVRDRAGHVSGGIAFGVPHGRLLERGSRYMAADRTLARAAASVFTSVATRIRARMERS